MMTSEDRIRDAWDALAPAYDLLTGFHDHDAWAAQLEGLARTAGLRGHRLLDVGCGTGSSAAAMLARGYDVAGIDVSPGMLELAARKLGPDVRLHCLDMRALPRLGEFDVVWCISDGVNFLLSDDDLVAAFAGFARNLAPGGLVVFDLDTLGSFRTLYSSMIVVPSADQVVIFEGRADGELGTGEIAEGYVERLEPAPAPPWWNRVRAVHRQRHHSEAAIEHALGAAGLALVAVWGTDGIGGSERPLDELRHSKAVYIAHAAAPELTERR
jgi:SAM-dependent methyltransferase